MIYYRHDFYAIALEQADIAIDHIYTKEASQSRIAQILIDNIYELCGQVCSIHEINKTSYWDRENPRFKKADKVVNSSKFEQVLDYLKEAGFIQQREKDVVSRLHMNRNQSFHKGKIDERIEFYISCLYMRELCSLMQKISIQSEHTCRNYTELNFRVKKYVAKLSCMDSDFRSAFDRINEMIERFDDNFKSKMLLILRSMREEIEGDVDSIRACGGNIPDRFEVEAQVEMLREKGILNSFMIKNGYDIDQIDPIEYRNKFIDLYSFPFRGNIYTQIDNLIGKIREEGDIGLCYCYFSDFISKSNLVIEGVTEWLWYAEQQVEAEMEEMRFRRGS